MNVFPPPLMTSDPGSFARATIVERKPKIIGQVIAENNYPLAIVEALGNFRDEIATQKIQPLKDQSPDQDFWNGALAAYFGKTWLEVPWYFAETCFYRRLLEAVRFRQPGQWKGLDPFRTQKQRQMQTDLERLAREWDSVSQMAPDSKFEALLHACLWGNRTDLSQTTEKERLRNASAVRTDQHLILIDHTELVRLRLAKKVKIIDFVTDNVGIDLLFDLVLADLIIQQGWALHIRWHLKDRPFFVSDATVADFRETVDLLQGSKLSQINSLGSRLAAYESKDIFSVHTDPFWTSCLMFRQMPANLKALLQSSDLVILKGDVNYRRLLDDLHWPHTAKVEEITDYFPASFIALRTLKSEIMVGLQPGQAEALTDEDPDWLINGKRGLIQLVGK
jgi:uncharacterized protein with ATP-grasp and redox domains